MVTQWVEDEFQTLDLGHKLRADRVKTFVSQAATFGESTPDRTRSKSQLKATYRLTDNPHVSADRILEAHHQSARERCGQYPVVYLAQDTTEVDLTKPKQQVRGAGSLAGGRRNGFFYHPLYAISDQGVSLGVVDEVLWTRNDDVAQQSDAPSDTDIPRAKRHQRCFEEKESSRWLEMMQSGEQIARSLPQTRFISLGDSEADISELIVQSLEFPENYDFIIRQCNTQSIVAAVDPTSGAEIDAASIDEALSQVMWLGEKTVQVGGREAPTRPDDKKRARKQARQSREALIGFRSVRVKLVGPKRPGGGFLEETWINVVEALEVDPPEGEEPIRWLLLTTLPVATAEQVAEVLQGYCHRWAVELYFKTLKSGLKIEDMKYETLDRYLRAFSMLTVVAWRIEYLKGACRATPDAPCTVYFTAQEWIALMTFLRRKKVDPSQPPTVGEFMVAVAELGGYVNKKSQGPPGSKTLWRGMSRFATVVEAYSAFMESSCGV